MSTAIEDHPHPNSLPEGEGTGQREELLLQPTYPLCSATLFSSKPHMAFNYYGVDWVAMVFTFVAIYLLGNKARAGFAIMMCGNSCWVVVGLLTQSIAMVLANAVFFAMNLRGFVRWAQVDSDHERRKTKD